MTENEELPTQKESIQHDYCELQHNERHLLDKGTIIEHKLWTMPVWNITPAPAISGLLKLAQGH